MFITINLKKIMKRIIVLAFIVSAILLAYTAKTILYPMRYSHYINRFSAENNLDRELVYAVINAESRFRYRAVSHVGASGLMQVMEPTANWIAEEMGLDGFIYEEDIFNPEINIKMGTWYLRRLLGIFGEEEVALAAYNAGTGRVSEWLEDDRYSDDGRTLSYIPFGETRRYVARIAHYREVYSVLLRWRSLWSNE